MSVLRRIPAPGPAQSGDASPVGVPGLDPAGSRGRTRNRLLAGVSLPHSRIASTFLWVPSRSPVLFIGSF